MLTPDDMRAFLVEVDRRFQLLSDRLHEVEQREQAWSKRQEAVTSDTTTGLRDHAAELQARLEQQQREEEERAAEQERRREEHMQVRLKRMASRLLGRTVATTFKRWKHLWGEKRISEQLTSRARKNNRARRLMSCLRAWAATTRMGTRDKQARMPLITFI